MSTAIVQPAGWGDVIISTCLVRALRAAGRRRLFYYTTSLCRGAVENNPDLDGIEICPVVSKDQAWASYDALVRQAQARHGEVIAPWAGYIPREHWNLPDGRSPYDNFMWAYARRAIELGLDVPVPLQLYLYPTDAEKARAADFVNQLPAGRRVLMEVRGESGQTCWSAQWSHAAVAAVMDRYGGAAQVLISCGRPEPAEVAELQARYPTRVHCLSHLSLREVSVVYNSCDVFLGVSSGTSNACHGHQCRRDVAWFEAVVDRVWDSSPLGTAGKTFYYNNNHLEYAQLLAAKLP